MQLKGQITISITYVVTRLDHFVFLYDNITQASKHHMSLDETIPESNLGITLCSLSLFNAYPCSD